MVCLLTSIFLPASIPASLFAAASTSNPGLKYYYPAPQAPVVDVAADMIVYGGTSGGVVAAVQAARMGKSVALVVFGRHVGGMTSGGLTQTDGVNAAVQGGITREFFNQTGNSGFKPSKAEQEFEKLLADPVPASSWDSPVPTYYEQRLDAVEMAGARIAAIRMENGSVFRGKMFIDCTYEGDLMARAGVSYTYGREARTTYNESLAGRQAADSLPNVNAYNVSGSAPSGLIYNLIDEPAGTAGSADTHIQAYNFRMYTVQNSNPANRQSLYQPSAYNPGDFEILYRFHRNNLNNSVGTAATNMTVGNDINNHEMFDRGCSTDHIGGNRWPDGAGGWIPWCEANYATREIIYQSHVAWQLGMLWYIKTDSRYRALATDPSVASAIRTNIQALLNKVDQLGLPLGEYTETGGWPHELYVREARRMVSDLVVTQAHYGRSIVEPDSVGLANYSADEHHVRRIPSPTGGVLVEGDTGGSTATPWRIPYRALVPKKSECENLLVTWAISASHVAFCSTRMEPCLMVLSQSAATAAALAIDRDEAVQDVPYDLLSLHLIADGQILGDAPATETGIIVDNGSASGFSTTGTWTASSSSTGYYGSNYLHDEYSSGGKTATFNPTLPESGNYEVQVRWTSNANRASQVPVDIVHTGSTTTISLNQQTGGGAWNPVGTYPFAAGTAGRVVIRNTGADGYVIADAVRFVLIGSPTAPNTKVSVVAADPVADEETATPARLQFVRETEDITSSLTVAIQTTGSAVAGTDYVALPASIIIPADARSVSTSISPIPDSIPEGTRTVTVTLQPSAAYRIGPESSKTVSILDKRYDGWRYRNFAASGLQASPGSDPGADPEGDGLENRLEFYLGTDPLSDSADGTPRLTIASGQAFYEYWQRGEAAQLNAVARFSNTLAPAAWQNFPTPAKTVLYDPATGDRLLRNTLPTDGVNGIFFRLEIP